MVAIFCPFSLFCEINISLLSLQTQPNTAPNLFQRGVEYGKYGLPALLQLLQLHGDALAVAAAAEDLRGAALIRERLEGVIAL